MYKHLVNNVKIKSDETVTAQSFICLNYTADWTFP